MSVLVVGLSHRSAPVAVLERAAVTGDALGKLLRDKNPRKAGAVMCGETTAPAADPEIAEAPADEGGIDEQSARMALPGRDDA